VRHAVIDPMVAASECSQDLVTDRAGIGGRRIDAVVVVQELDKAAGLRQCRVGGRNVENGEVHRNSAEKRKPPAAETTRTTMAQRAEPTVGVADRNGCKAAGSVHDMRRTVANRLTSVNLADLQDFSLQPNDL